MARFVIRACFGAFTAFTSIVFSASPWDMELVFPEASPSVPFRNGSSPMGYGGNITVWPVTKSEYESQTASDPVSHDEDSLAQAWFRWTLATGFFPGNKQYPFGETFEIFNGNWGSLHLPAEQGVAYNQVPPALSLSLAYPFSPHVFAYARASLKRDMRAWFLDPAGGNWPTTANEVDLNEPSLGYLVADASWGRALFGRFPVHLGPSPEFSLLVGGQKPFHDGALVTLKAPAFRYHFFFASLHTWLEGTPRGDTSSTNYPVGSEAWRQRHYVQHDAENAHLRVYDERAKSLVVHRVEWLLGEARENAGRLGAAAVPQPSKFKLASWGAVFGLSEMQTIGGKVPDLFDVAPFMVWHNDFKYGYTNNLVHVDARINSPFGLSLFGELAMDDLPYAPKEGEKQKAILGGLLGSEYRFLGPAYAWVQRLHFIHTDPKLYRFVQPYNSLYARQVLNTNMQPSSDPNFMDRLVIDYPVGYVRGGDARDFWSTTELSANKRPWLPFGAQFTLKLAYLQHGQTDERTQVQSIPENATTPTGAVREEWRESLDANIGITRRFSVLAGIGGRQWAERGKTGSHAWAQAGLVWSGAGSR
jgi:hypothetical protein